MPIPRGSSSNHAGAAALVLVLALTLAAAACAPFAPQVRPEASTPSAQTLIARLEHQQGLIQTFAGRGSLDLKKAGSGNHFTAMVAAARPDRLRWQAFDFLGRPVLTLTADGGELNIFDHRQSVLQQGPATPENLARVFPLGLNISQLITLLTGGQPLWGHEQAQVEPKREFGADLWRLSLFLFGGGQVEHIWLVNPDLTVNRVEVETTAGEILYRLEYSDYRKVEAPPGLSTLPFRIHFSALENDRELIISYDELRINPELPAGLFRFVPPPGVTVKPIPLS